VWVGIVTKKIMVVDDNADVIMSIRYGLEDVSKEYQVIGAESGKQCLDLLEQNEIPDLIFLDIMMPEMSGWQIFDKIKAHDSWKTIPVVFLTARTDKTAKDAGQFLGDDFIEKPFEIKDVKNCINKILGNKKSDTS
jgi:CheY-like chemotaxis protein